MLTSVLEGSTNYLVAEPDRVLRAKKQEALLRQLDRAEKKASQKAETSEILRYEAAQLRRDALLAARKAGVPAAELADRLGVSVQRVYQLLSDGIPTASSDDGVPEEAAG